MEEGRSIDWGIDLSTKPGERFVLFICTFLFNMKKKNEKKFSGSKKEKERNEHSGGGNWKHDR